MQDLALVNSLQNGDELQEQNDNLTLAQTLPLFSQMVVEVEHGRCAVVLGNENPRVVETVERSGFLDVQI